MQASFTIEHRFPGLNEYTSANRSNRAIGSKMKHDETEVAAWYAKAARLPHFDRPVWVTFHWYEASKGRRRDIDNVAFAKKFVLDGLVEAGVIDNDDPAHVVGFRDMFSYRDDPHVVVTISEVADE